MAMILGAVLLLRCAKSRFKFVTVSCNVSFVFYYYCLQKMWVYFASEKGTCGKGKDEFCGLLNKWSFAVILLYGEEISGSLDAVYCMLFKYASFTHYWYQS